MSTGPLRHALRLDDLSWKDDNGWGSQADWAEASWQEFARKSQITTSTARGSATRESSSGEFRIQGLLVCRDLQQHQHVDRGASGEQGRQGPKQ